jgi:MarR family transcriptional regulator, 2-MHQ and catechol-resistance regulon repressor
MSGRNTHATGVHLWLVLMKAQQALRKYALRSIAGSSLCFSDFAVLEVLLHKGPLPVNTVGATVSLTSGPSTAAIDRLEKKGLVRRAPDAVDRRARIVHLTEKGNALISAAFRQHESDMEAVTSGLSLSEKAALISLLKRLGKTATAG